MNNWVSSIQAEAPEIAALALTISAVGYWALAGAVAMGLYGWRRATRHRYAPGDHVLYSMPKYSNHPGPRAMQVVPNPNGEGYHYIVRKPWTISRLVGDDQFEVVTNGGKSHLLRMDDPLCRRAGWLDSLVMYVRWHKLFPRSR